MSIYDNCLGGYVYIKYTPRLLRLALQINYTLPPGHYLLARWTFVQIQA